MGQCTRQTVCLCVCVRLCGVVWCVWCVWCVVLMLTAEMARAVAWSERKVEIDCCEDEVELLQEAKRLRPANNRAAVSSCVPHKAHARPAQVHFHLVSVVSAHHNANARFALLHECRKPWLEPKW